MTVAYPDFGDDAQPAPSHPVPMSQGNWAYSTGRKADGDHLPRGVYRQGKDGEWLQTSALPYVSERLTRRDGYGRSAGTEYRLSMHPLADSGDIAVCPWEQVRDGDWADLLDVPLSADKKIVDAAATAIRLEGHRQGRAREITPRWRGDGLELPSADVGPAGYGELVGSEDEARAAWREVATIATRSPKVALLLGVAAGAMYVAPLDRQSFWVQAVGRGRGGKTSAITAAGAVYGSPSDVVQVWNTTQVGLTAELGSLSVMPAFRDELGASGFKRDQLEALVFRVTQGASRTVGTKTSGHRKTAAWHGALITSGNDSILGGCTNEGIAARVLEIPVPVVNDRADADRLKLLARAAYGWPLYWLRCAENSSPADVAPRIAAAEDELPLPDGGVPRTIGEHLALGVAGAGLLDDVFGTDTMRPAALDAARLLLAELVAEARERGMSPGERVLAAIMAALSSRPGAFPTRTHYREATSGSGNTFLRHEVEGWVIQDESKPGDVAILPGALDSITADAGIADPTTGLRELERDDRPASAGRLIRAKDGRRDSLRVHGLGRPSVYVFAFPEDSDDQPHRADDGDQGSSSAPGPVAADEDQAEPEPPALNLVPAAPGGNSAQPAPVADAAPATTSADKAEIRDETGSGPSSNSVDDQSRRGDDAMSERTVIVVGRDGPVWIVGTSATCRVCSEGTISVDPVGPVHPACATGTAVYSPQPQQSDRDDQTPPTAPVTPASSAPKLALAAVLDSRGLWLHQADEPMQVEAPTTVDAAYALAIEHGARQLWVHPSAHDLLGIPADRDPAQNPASPVADPWVKSTRLKLDPDGLAAWMNVRPITGEGRRVALVFPAYDRNRVAWHRADDGRQLLAGVYQFAGEMGESYYYSPNETGAAIVRKSVPAERLDGGEMPPPAGKIKHLVAWSRTLLDEEDQDALTVHRYDLNYAELAVSTDIWLGGNGSPKHETSFVFDRNEHRHAAGYALARIPRRHAALDTRLPNLVVPWEEADDQPGAEPDGPAWVHFGTLTLLAELGVPIECEEAWIWPESFRTLRPYHGKVTKGRNTLKAASSMNPAAALAYDVTKSVYTSRIGDYNRAGSRIMRPDFRDATKARMTANMYRRLRKIGQSSGRFPVAIYADAVFYLSDEPDPVKAAPKGLALGDRGGEWKPEGSVPLASVREHLGEIRGVHRYFERELERKFGHGA